MSTRLLLRGSHKKITPVLKLLHQNEGKHFAVYEKNQLPLLHTTSVNLDAASVRIITASRTKTISPQYKYICKRWLIDFGKHHIIVKRTCNNKHPKNKSKSKPK